MMFTIGIARLVSDLRVLSHELTRLRDLELAEYLNRCIVNNESFLQKFPYNMILLFVKPAAIHRLLLNVPNVTLHKVMLNECFNCLLFFANSSVFINNRGKIST